MLKATEGIIISEVNYGEKSKIINVLTKDGILGVMCKGTKSLKSPLRTSTMKFNLSSFLLYYHENGLSTLKECDVICDYKNIKSDILLISYMSYICDLAAGVMRQNENEEIYNLLISTLSKINDGFAPDVLTNIFEIKMLDYLGVGFSLDACAKCGNTKDIVTIDPDDGGYICSSCYTNQIIYDAKTLKMLRMYYLVDIDAISKLDISKEVKDNIDYFLKTYYDRYTGLYLKSKKFLETMKN